MQIYFSYGTRQSFHLYHSVTTAVKARKCGRYLLPSLINNTAQAILDTVQTHNIGGFSFHMKTCTIKDCGSICHIKNATYVKEMIKFNGVWCILLIMHISNEQSCYQGCWFYVQFMYGRKWYFVLSCDHGFLLQCYTSQTVVKIDIMNFCQVHVFLPF